MVCEPPLAGERGATGNDNVAVHEAQDLKKLGIESVPDRVLVQIDLVHDAGRWSARARRSDGKETPAADLGKGDATELELAETLARYTKLCAPEKGRGRIPFIRLQQRLLSSPEAFARSLEVHVVALERQGGPKPKATQLELAAPEVDADLFGPTDEVVQAEDDAVLEAESAALPAPAEEASTVLRSLRAIAERARRAPDAKVRALLAWMGEHLCAGIGSGAPRSKARTPARLPRPPKRS